MNNENEKKVAVVLTAFTIWLILVIIVITYWLFTITPYEKWLAQLSFLSAAIWWIVLLWGIHHLTFQIASIFSSKKSNPKQQNQGSNDHIALIYPTCDDFVFEAAESCLNQNYENYKIYICDDSKEKKYIRRIKQFVHKNRDKCNLIRRNTNTGFKAGNINNAILNEITEEWILLIDADQYLPEGYLSKITKYIPTKKPKVAFIQARNDSRPYENKSIFQQNLKDEITLYYMRDLDLRSRYGFMPLLGHGALIKKTSFIELGCFPEVVSEDFAFALKAASKGYSSIHAYDAKSFETYPYDFGSFIIRIKKFSGGTAEIIKKSLFNFLFSKAKIVEKWDFLIMLLWYVLIPFIVLNGFISAYVTHRYWLLQIPYIHPILPYLYTYLLLSIITVILSIERGNFYSAIKFYFWTTSIYSASMPIIALNFLKGFLIRPRFIRTPKDGTTTHVSSFDTIFTILSGFFALIASIVWWSPFSWFLLGHSISYISFPLYSYINCNNFLGWFTQKVLIYLPGCLMITALIAIWHYQK